MEHRLGGAKFNWFGPRDLAVSGSIIHRAELWYFMQIGGEFWRHKKKRVYFQSFSTKSLEILLFLLIFCCHLVWNGIQSTIWLFSTDEEAYRFTPITKDVLNYGLWKGLAVSVTVNKIFQPLNSRTLIWK